MFLLLPIKKQLVVFFGFIEPYFSGIAIGLGFFGGIGSIIEFIREFSVVYLVSLSVCLYFVISAYREIPKKGSRK